MPTPRDRSRSASTQASVPSLSRAIYLDYNATTPLDPTVLAKMHPFLTEEYGNAASRTHSFGQVALAAVEQAREQVASLIGGEARGIIWTSGATEANNLAIKGVVHSLRERGRHIITQATEHPAVLDPCEFLREWGLDVTVLPVDEHGVVSPDDVLRAMRKDTALVSIMYANNETGVLQPIREIATLCRRHEVAFHTDATQAAGKVDIAVKEWGIDLLSLSAHKIYGPKGVGALFVRPGLPKLRLVPLLHGGGHERGLRSGTLNVPGIVGFGAACSLASDRMAVDNRRSVNLRNQLEQALTALTGIRINGVAASRLPNTASIAIEGIDAEAALVAMPNLAVSTGSACTSTSVEPSHVLAAMGLSEALIRGTIRFSIGRSTTESEISAATATLKSIVSRLRALRHV